MLSNMNSYSQELYTKKLYWNPKSKAINEAYRSTYDFVNDSKPAVKNNKLSFLKMNISDFLNKIFKRSKMDKQLMLKKQIKQNEMKKHLDSSFVIVHDSVVSLGFKNKKQIKDWCKNLYFYTFPPGILSTELSIKGNNFLILLVDSCSGFACLSFYVFKEKDNIWELETTSSQVRIQEQLHIRIDNDAEKIIFETPSYQMGELTFKTLL